MTLIPVFSLLIEGRPSLQKELVGCAAEPSRCHAMTRITAKDVSNEVANKMTSLSFLREKDN